VNGDDIAYRASTSASSKPYLKASLTEVDLPFGVSEEEWNSHVAAGKAMEILTMRAKGTCYVEHGSVYGAALALPQYARTSGWALHYTALAIRSYIFLISNVMLQAFLLYMISKEERINDKFGGQMHLCNFGAGVPQCPHASDCKGPRGTMYTVERLYDWQMWANRIFVRDAFEALFPDRMAEISKYVDPGEYGLESYWLRLSCCFLFVMGLWPDMVGTKDLCSLLVNVPTAPEPWLYYEAAGKFEHRDIQADLDSVKYKVAGMPMHWKIINLVFVAAPKAYIWFLMVDIGTLFLMETAGIEDMIMNAVALSFILSIDELICAGLFSDTSKHMLDSLEPLPLFEAVDQESEKSIYERHQTERQWTCFTLNLYATIFPRRLGLMLFCTVFFQFKYFLEHCDKLEDGSWVGKELHLPVTDGLSFLSFLFGPFPNLFPVQPNDEIVWKMPTSD
jgi:hypothetical protein